MKKPPKLDEKTKKKIGDLINEKLLKHDKKIKRKTNHLYFVQYFVQCFIKVKNL